MGQKEWEASAKKGLSDRDMGLRLRWRSVLELIVAPGFY